MAKVKKHITFSDPTESPYGIAYIKKEMEAKGCSKMNETIERIFAEHDEMKTRLNDEDALVEKIFQRFKQTLDIIRVRAGHTDKNSQINLELWNAFLMASPLDVTVLTDHYTSESVAMATEKVSKDIAAFKQRKDEQKARQTMRKGEK
ncbi:hypothetical protein MF621_004225 (plasmid) [Bacillus velezensis]|uniref:hypothetical protein n=1 Tax=Bacillus TaxID=1386 RepID=UPI001ABDED3F|nr:MULTISPECIES: hypothetical protein [Bacillus]MBR7817982.1 hypothetical protein [Bacillus sp. CCNWLCWHY013]MDJ0479959.1 hypothetical protein [Bacillus amyloliquefaciens]MED2914204.1 hypothetical protein [Bacillus velezensis]QTG87457.1 hypothetical protein J4048_21750 [Bacillus amyloliquefaciens]QYC35296.1 hypothetical protein J5X95_20525 [Bacillus amyloliquefaciens]